MRLLIALLAATGVIAIAGTVADHQEAQHPPARLLINGETRKVVLAHPVDDDLDSGSTECTPREIHIESEQSAYAIGDTLLHEIQHAFSCDKGEVHNERFNNKKSGDHAGIYFATPKWQALIRENPELIRFIQQAKKP